MKNKQKITCIILTIFLIIQFIGRLIPLPIHIIIYIGYSMQSTINYGDILICISKDIVRYKVGDIVVYYNGYMYYVAHRILEIQGNQILMKGDNAVNIDPPVTDNYIKYKVVMIIPYYNWIIPIIIFTLIFIIIKRRHIISLIKRCEQLEVVIFIAFIVSTLILIATIPINDTYVQSIIKKPLIELKEIKVLNHSKVLVEYNLEHTYPKDIEECVFKIANYIIKSRAHLIGVNSIVIETPMELYKLAYENKLETIYFKLKVVFDKGFIEGNYMYTINWRKLEVRVDGNLILIFNPNYVPINISSIKIMYMNLSDIGFTKFVEIEELKPIIIKPEEIYKLKIMRKSQFAYIEFKYKFLGEEVIEKRKIDFIQ